MPTKKKQQTKHTNPKIVNKSRIKAYSNEWAKFNLRHGITIRKTYRFLDANLKKLKSLKRGESIITKDGVKITKEHTGSYKGNNNILTLKIDYKNKEFFVRIEPENAVSNQQHVFETVNEYLKQLNHKVNGFNIQLIKPHIFIRTADKQKVITVTDFYKPNEVTLGIDLPKQEQTHLNTALNPIARKLAFRGITDLALHNVFYNRQTKTILLFDLNQTQ
jgi:hypothetical protein